MEKPFVVGKAEWNYTEREKLAYETQEDSADRGLPVKCDGFDEKKVDAVVHVFRESLDGSDTSLVRVYDSKEFGRPFVGRSPLVHPSLKEGESLSQDTNFEATKEEGHGLLAFQFKDYNVRAWSLRHSKVAALIQERIEHPLFFYLKVRLGAIKGGHFAIVGFEMTAHKYIEGPEDGHSTPIFNSREEKEKHGVTLLHILSEMQEDN